MPTRLPRNVPLGRVIARRKLTLRDKPSATAELRIGTPVARADYAYCPVQLVGIGDEKVRPCFGVDTIQALQLAFLSLEVLLLHHEKVLQWEGDPALKSLQMDAAQLLRDAGLAEFLGDLAALMIEHGERVARRRVSSTLPTRKRAKRPQSR